VTGIVLVGTVRCVVGVVVDTGRRSVVVVVVGMVVVAGRVVVVGFGCRPSTKVETSSANTTRLTLNLYRSATEAEAKRNSIFRSPLVRGRGPRRAGQYCS
jgi:hypothetical protein